MATHATVLFPLANPGPHGSHFSSEAWSDGYLSGVGLDLWKGSAHWERMRDLSALAGGHLVFVEPDGSYRFKEEDYIADNLLDEVEDPDARIPHPAFQDLTFAELVPLIERFVNHQDLDPSLEARLRDLGDHERFGQSNPTFFTEMSSRLLPSLGEAFRSRLLDADDPSEPAVFLTGDQAALVAWALFDHSWRDPHQVRSTSYAIDQGRVGAFFEAPVDLRDQIPRLFWLPLSMIFALNTPWHGSAYAHFFGDHLLERACETDRIDLAALARARPVSIGELFKATRPGDDAGYASRCRQMLIALSEREELTSISSAGSVSLGGLRL